MNKGVNKEIVFYQEEFKEQRRYWLNVVEGELSPIQLTLDYKRIENREKKYLVLQFELTEDLSVKLVTFSKHSDPALYIMLLAAFKALLFRICRNEEILVLSPLLNIDKKAGIREQSNQKVLLRDPVDTGQTFKQLLIQTKGNTLQAYENQDYPLELVLKEKGLNQKDVSFIDRIIFLLKNIHYEERLFDLKYDLLFSIEREEQKIKGKIFYDSHLFKEDRIKRMIRQYTCILQQALQDIEQPIRNFDILPQEELILLLKDFNNSTGDFSLNKSIYEQFEEQAARTPERTALVFKQQVLTYGILNEKANQMAWFLQEKGVGSGSLIALIMDNSQEMIIAILGILKTGGAYLPIDPQYPLRRILSILKDSAAAILLTKEKIVKHLPFISLRDFEMASGRPVISPPRPQVQDLDSLQIPDRSLINYEKYRPYIAQAMVKNSVILQYSRGCVFNCAYCFKIWTQRYVNRSAENMFEEMNLYYKMGIRRFGFVDDLPNLNVKESSKLFKLIIKNGLDVHLHFPNGIRGDILTRDYIDLMVEAGTVTMDLALETSSPRLQKLIRKNLNVDRLRENLLYIIDKYPHVILECQILHGLPTETEEEAGDSLEFIKNLKWIHFPYMHLLKIFPNTEMARLAIAHGVSPEAIERSADMGYHEIPETIPFPKTFTRQYQTEFVNDYFLNRERLKAVLPMQMKTLTEEEAVQKYNSYLPMEIRALSDLLKQAGISREELKGNFLPENYGMVPNLNQQIKQHFYIQEMEPVQDALKILLLDLSQYFSNETNMIYDVMEPPLGLIYLLTHLKRIYKSKINGKIAKSRLDFDNYDELKKIVDEFKPDVIGIRSLNFYKDFFHKTISLLRQWGVIAPIIAGGPYATSSFATILKDTHIDLIVLGEGEITFAEIIGKILENDKKLPGEDILKYIPGISFMEKTQRQILKRHSHEIFFMDRLNRELANQPVTNLGVNKGHTLEDLAYIIYTSGSTGYPKGTLVQHNHLANQIVGLRQKFNFAASFHYILLASYTFDVSLMHIFLPLTTGAKLFLIDEETRKDSIKLWNYIYKKGIDVLNIVPAFMKALLENLNEREFHFKHLFVGGDVFGKSLYKGLRSAFSIEKLYNIYGPTETTINAILHECKFLEIDEEESIPIGKPLLNYRVYILDNDLNPVSIGEIGEIFIAGLGVTRGYLNRVEFTAGKFLPDPFVKGARMYRTGDLGKWLPDGDIDFQGRKDNQVKIRGFRIELDEIEKRFLEIEGIKEAVVLIKQDESGDKHLCAFITSNKNMEINKLKECMKAELPEYMIPTFIVQIDKIPFTSNHKIDTNTLKKKQLNIMGNYVPPSNEIEISLAQMWSEVLRIEKQVISTDSNFFELGGHSLKATILISKIHKQLDVSIPLVQLFRTPNIKGLSDYIKQAAPDKFLSIESAEKKEYYSLSSAQKRLYFIHQLNINSTVYNMSSVIPLEGKIDEYRIEETFKKLIQRHESLRTSFVTLNEEPVQRIHDAVLFKIKYDDRNAEQPANEILNIRNYIKPFDLSQAPLLRVVLIKEKESEFLLVADMHHIISDGISHQILIKDFTMLYGKEELPLLKLQYKDYSCWQQSQRVKKEQKQQEEYWIQQFKEDIPVLNLPIDFPRPTVQSFAGSLIRFEINKEETEFLTKLADSEKATLFMVLMAIYNVFLWKLTNQEDIIVGTPFSGRKHADLEKIIGIFVNTIALRNFPTGEQRFTLFLSEVKDRTLKAFENQDYQFENLIEKVVFDRDMSRNPLFDVSFSLQDIFEKEDETAKENKEKTNIKKYVHEHQTSKFDLTLLADKVGDKLYFIFEYCTKLFKKETIERFIKYFKNIIISISKKPEKKILEIDIISSEEKKQLLFEFNQTRTDYPKEISIPGLFEQQVQQNIHRSALVGQSSISESPITYTIHLSYGILQEKSNQLAGYLKQKGVQIDTIIGIITERSIDMIIGILGILKAGGAYLPIDWNFPTERIQYMLMDANAKLLLKDNKKNKEVNYFDFKRWKGEMIFLGDIAVSSELTSIKENQPELPSATSLAYIIYTSGSSGKPKGVLTMQYNVSRVIRNTNYIHLTSKDRLLQLSNYAFDGSVFDIYGALLNSGVLVMVRQEEILAVHRLANIIKREAITTIFVTTALFNTLVDVELSCFDGIKSVLFGGERVSVNHSRKALAYLGKDRIIHVYGPTETTVYAAYYPINEIDDTAYTIPIGKPIGNTAIYILDKYFDLVPIGINGELYIGGQGNARGYLNNPELTARKFKKDVISQLTLANGKFQRNVNSSNLSNDQCLMTNDNLYRTGDLARYLPNGNIEFIGRIDSQVKIRGFRIEFGEIESILLTHREIKETLVLDRENKIGDKYLCAYFVSGTKLTETELKEYLNRHLPDYMIPSFFIQLEKIPLTPNGKIDRKALPEPEIETRDMHISPRNNVEEKLAGIWAEILGIEKKLISMDANFFQLGGHSLKAAVMVTKIHKELNRVISLIEIFKSPTIEGIASLIGIIDWAENNPNAYSSYNQRREEIEL